MIRTPLRPLARILEARRKGENPDAIERENIRLRHEEMQDRARARAESRLLVLGLFFFCAFMVIGGRMGLVAISEPMEPRAAATGAQIAAQRADIVDRHGRILATNFETHSLYAQPPQMIEPERAADALVKIFPDLDRDRLVKEHPLLVGKMTAADITNYVAKDRNPVCAKYRTYKICGMGPPSSGGIAVAQMLGQLERFDLSALGPDDAEFWHLFLESQRIAYADRELYVGDEDFVSVPVAGLVDPDYLAKRSALIDRAKAIAEATPGTPPGAPLARAE